jgi:hypothetical protein
VKVLAPLLAEAAHAQGWPLDATLASYLTQKPRRGTQKGPTALLRDRIEDLPRFRAAQTAAEPPSHQLRFPEPSTPGDTAHPNEPGLPPADPAAVRQAQDLLLSLDGPWALSPESAERLAPLLAAKAIERGWAFDGELRAKLMENPGGVRNHELLLETRRISRLPYRKTVGQQPEPGSKPEWCGSCESPDYRWITPREGLPSKCPQCNPSVALATT